MSGELVLMTRQDGLVHIRLNSAGTANALSLPMIEALVQAMLSISDADRAVLISAEGRHFCVGGDMNAFVSGGDRGDTLRAMAGRLHEGMTALDALKIPVITAVNGAAAGAGFSLAVSGDIVIAGEGSSFCMAYTGIGFTPDGGATHFLPRLIGLRRAQRMAYLNERVDASTALEWGLVSEVVADDALLDTAMGVAQKIAAGPTRAFSRIKRLFDDGALMPLPALLNAETAAISASAASKDGNEGVDAFLEKRKPTFTGQ